MQNLARYRATILLLDDQPSVVSLFSSTLDQAGFRVLTARTGQEALDRMTRDEVDLVLADVRMSNMSGWELLTELRARGPTYVPVILVSGACIQSPGRLQGQPWSADDDLFKPVMPAQLVELVRARLRKRDRLWTERETGPGPAPAPGAGSQDREEAPRTTRAVHPVRTPRLAPVFDLLSRIAPSLAPVLFTGETGTGKGLFARYLHDISPRRSRPWVETHCASIPPDLLASELFGHERGAFTGADRQRVGRCECAEGGSLFLDEIGDLAIPVQVALLRFCQDGTFERLGGQRTQRGDVRIMAATHQDLRSSMAGGAFREDLYYRLSVFKVEIPALRDRPEDIRVLAHHILKACARRAGKPVATIDPGAMARLESHPWPGNVRELGNVIERAVFLAPATRIASEEIVLEPPRTRMQTQTQTPGHHLPGQISEFERDRIVQALESAGGNHARAARILGIPRTSLLGKLKRFGLSPGPGR